ncbi:MAG: hypothetical protein ACFE9S_07675 [Candidatus Hermodarchaeota archaeon]
MSEELESQGSQLDGNPPEPSQDTEGNTPVPSQDNTGQLTDQQLEQMLPDQDDRGVPKENVLSEVLRKVNKLSERFDNLEATKIQQQYQQPIQQQPYQPPQQSQSITPRTADEIAEIVDKEAREKYGDAFAQGTVDYWELQKFQNRRTVELTRQMMSNVNSVQSERIRSEARIKEFYPDLQPNTALSHGVLNELNRRAYMMGISPQSLYERDPYILESITPLVARQMGINSKIQNSNIKIQPKSDNLPPNNFPGRETPKPENIKPTQNDINVGKRFGVKPETLANIRQKSPGSSEFIDESGMLYS